MKSKGVAYLLWLFLGAVGAHRFYLGKIGTGLIYLCTLGLFGVGLIYDLFTLGGQVDTYNAVRGARNRNSNVNTQTVIVNMPPQQENKESMTSIEKQ